MAVPALQDTQVVLAVPPVSVSTALAYRELTSIRLSGPAVLDVQEVGRHRWLAENAVNDFEPSVFRRHPELKEIQAAIAEQGAAVARLTGSGAAVYGIFPNRPAAESARASLAGGRKDVHFSVVEALASQPEPEPRM